jgi:serine/threonine-protein kinase
VHGKEFPKILDFGIAKVKSKATQMVGRQSSHETLTAFTPAYGAPEQWLPKRFGQTGTWTDVWGLAITLVECLTGRPPIDGDEPGAMMGSAIDPERRPTPRAEGANVNDDVEAAFRKALAVDPKDRTHRIVDFWSDLVRASRGTSAAKPAAGAAGRAAQPAPAKTVQAPPPASVAPGGPDLVPDLVIATPSKKPPSAGGPSARPRGAVQAPSAAPRSAGGPPAAFIGKTVADLDDDFEFGPQRPLQLDSSTTNEIANARAPAAKPVAAAVSAPSRVAAAAVPRGSSTMYEPSVSQAPGRPLELKGPIQVLVIAILLMAADWFYAAATGTVFHVGPARAFWIAGPLAIYGVAMLALRILRHSE